MGPLPGSSGYVPGASIPDEDGDLHGASVPQLSTSQPMMEGVQCLSPVPTPRRGMNFLCCVGFSYSTIPCFIL